MSRVTTHAYRKSAQPGADTTLVAIGGNVTEFTAGGTLLVGDMVYITAENVVNKSAAGVASTAFVGFVVGGKQTGGHLTEVSSDVGKTAALVNESVIVQFDGICHTSSVGVVAAGNTLLGSGVTAGKVIVGTTAGSIVGTALSAGTAATIKIKIQPR